MKKLWVLMLIAALTVFSIGCSAQADSKTQVVIATGGTSGSYYAVGSGIGSLINKYSENIDAVVQGTNGAVENVRLLNSGDAQIGFGNSDAIYFGYNGTGPFEQPQKVLGAIALYKSGGQMFTLESAGIRTFEDLKGKKVNLGPNGSTVTEMSKAMLESYGIDYENDIEAQYLSFAEGAEKVGDGDIDASFIVSGIPTAALINLSNSTDIRLLSLDDEHSEKIIDKYPYYDSLTIEAGTYKNVDESVQSLQLWTTLMVSDDLEPEIVEEILTIIFEHQDELEEIHVSAKDISLDTASKLPVPLHPGAENYFGKQ